MEALSGFDLSDVRVFRNSARPAQVEAHAFAQGNDIHLGPGQERHLPHEAWHIVQQRQGRVRPTLQAHGAAINDDFGLEQEADVMAEMGKSATNSEQVVHGATPNGRATTLPSQATPLQRVRWQWHDPTRRWSPIGSSSSTSQPPAFPGRFDTEIFDDEADTYSAHLDPSVGPYLTGNNRFMGEEAAREQIRGVEPTAEKVRVPSRSFSGRVRGTGMHELVATDQRRKVAQRGSAAMIGMQSGGRTNTDLTFFVDPNTRSVSAHSGLAINPGKSYTSGQKRAHDALRAASDSVLTEKNPRKVVATMTRAQIGLMPTGQDLLSSSDINGLTHNVQAFGTIEDYAPSGVQGPKRIRLAQDFHQRREMSKQALRAFSEPFAFPPPSPERSAIDDFGGGGDYALSGDPVIPMSALPNFEYTSMYQDEGDFEYAANAASFLTAPFRVGTPLTPFSPSAASSGSAVSTSSSSSSSSLPASFSVALISTSGKQPSSKSRNKKYKKRKRKGGSS